VAFASLVLAGCGATPSGRMNVLPVSGQVLLNGQPLPDAVVVFHPLQPFSDKSADFPRAVTDAKGLFRLSTYSANDGAPLGEYLVSIDAAPPAESILKPPDPLAGRYRDPRASGLKATISQPNQSIDFQLNPSQPAP
jgi:hypothetical protein